LALLRTWRRTVINGVTHRSHALAVFPLGLACSTAEASHEARNSLDTIVAPLDAADRIAPADVPFPRASQRDADIAYVGLRRAYSAADMRFHACAALGGDGRVVGHDCPAGVVVSGPRIVAPTHSDVRVRFEIESEGGVKLMSAVVSDDVRRVHGGLDLQTLSAHEKLTVTYGVHVFEAAPALEARIALRGDAPLDFHITNLEIEVR
jgi:hypothetical protein